jgi:hypothetical protein
MVIAAFWDSTFGNGPFEIGTCYSRINATITVNHIIATSTHALSIANVPYSISESSMILQSSCCVVIN